MRLRRLRRWWPVIPILLTVLVVYAAMPGRSTFTVSPETTHVTEPLDAEGYVDYPTALNERLSKGVTPETNANVLIWQALGPHPEGGTMPPAYFKWLGIESPPEEGEYFLGLHKYFQDNLENRAVKMPDEVDEFDTSPDPKQEWYDLVDRACKWPWQTKEQPDIAAWLKRNEKPLGLVVAGARRPHYYNPLVSKSTDPRDARLISSLLPSAQKCRELGTAQCCRAMSRTADGDLEGAWQDLLTCHRLGRLIASRGSLIETLVGIAIQAKASTAEITFLGHGKHSSAQILAWRADLQKLPAATPFADKLDLCERFMMLDSLLSVALSGGRNLDRLADFPGPNRKDDRPWDKLFTRSVDFDPAFRIVNQAIDRWVAAGRLPDRASRKQELDKCVADIIQMKGEITEVSHLDRALMGKEKRGEFIGKILIALLLPAVQKIQDAADRSEQVHSNLLVAFALAAYRADAGRYPARLDDLAPKYLAKIPPDIFSGKPLIYRPTENGYLFYSVGVNGIDEDGRWTDNDPKGDDLRVRMPVPEPKLK